MTRAIPISSEQHPREMIRSLQTASDALRNDEIVCIFAEGQITRTGQLLPFRRGLERIMKNVDEPIIPVNLDGVWGSIFSFERGRFLWKMPRRIPYRVTVSFGKPMAPTSTAIQVRARGAGVACECVRAAEAVYADAGSRVCAHGTPVATAVHDGGWEDAASDVWLGAFKDDVYRASAAATDRRTEDDGAAAAPVGRGGADELRADADGARSGEPELHVVERDSRVVRYPVRYRCGDHVEGVRGTLSEYADSGARDSAGGCARYAAGDGEDCGAGVCEAGSGCVAAADAGGGCGSESENRRWINWRRLSFRAGARAIPRA